MLSNRFTLHGDCFTKVIEPWYSASRQLGKGLLRRGNSNTVLFLRSCRLKDGDTAGKNAYVTNKKRQRKLALSESKSANSVCIEDTEPASGHEWHHVTAAETQIDVRRES